MADDNILAAFSGFAQGLSSTLVPMMQDKYRSRLKREEETQQALAQSARDNRLNEFEIGKEGRGLANAKELAEFGQKLKPREKVQPINDQTGLPEGPPIFGEEGGGGLSTPKVGKPPVVKQTEEEKLSAKYESKKKQLFPKAKVAIKNVISSLDKEIKNIDEILTDPDLNMVTGPYASRVTTLSGGQARVRAKIDQLKAQAFLSSFTSLKNASPNGSAGTGALSENEGTKLEKSAVNADTKLQTPDFKKALSKYRTELEDSKQNFHQGFQDEYSNLIGSGEMEPPPGAGGMGGGQNDLRPGGTFNGKKILNMKRIQ